MIENALQKTLGFDFEEATEKAVAGGWRAKEHFGSIKMTSGNWKAIMTSAGSFSHVWLLDPDYWHAVGKVEWGDGALQMNSRYAFRPPVWKDAMHRFIDALCEENSD